MSENNSFTFWSNMKEAIDVYDDVTYKYKLYQQILDILINLMESKINFINIEGASCYQSSILQGFVHLIYPKAIQKLNEEKIKNGESIIQNLDEFKNNTKFNDMVIDILKEINNLEKERKNNSNNKIKSYLANKIFEEYPPEKGRHQGLLNEYDCNKLHELLINCDISKDTSDEIIIKINKTTPISYILKFKIENIY